MNETQLQKVIGQLDISETKLKLHEIENKDIRFRTSLDNLKLFFLRVHKEELENV